MAEKGSCIVLLLLSRQWKFGPETIRKLLEFKKKQRSNKNPSKKLPLWLVQFALRVGTKRAGASPP